MTVLWANNYPNPIHQCQGCFCDLFENDFDFCSSFDEVRDASMVRLVQQTRLAPLPAIHGAIEIADSVIDVRRYTDVAVIAITAFNPFLIPGEDFLQVLLSLRSYINELVPERTIAQTVQRFEQTHFDGPTIGVHIRRTDFKEASKRFNYRETEDEDYWALVERCLLIRPELKVFIATDCEETRQRFLTRFGADVCRYCVQTINRLTADDTRSALIDMLLLSQTNFVCGAPRSSFSLFSRLRRGLDYGCVVPAGIRNSPLELQRLAQRIAGLAGVRGRS